MTHGAARRSSHATVTDHVACHTADDRTGDTAGLGRADGTEQCEGRD